MKNDGALVLIVDDFPDNREMYAEYLTYTGYRVAEAASGQEALQRAFDLHPDIILMDLALPGLDGWEATRRLKADPRTSDIPVVAVTGHALAGHQRMAVEAGCAACLVKPCLPEDLVREIRRVMGDDEPGGVEPSSGRRQARRAR